MPKNVQTTAQLHSFHMGFPGSSDGKASVCNAGDPGSIPRLGRSPGEWNDNLLQYSCLENSMDGGAWWATVHGVTKSRTRLSNFTFFLSHASKVTPQILQARLQQYVNWELPYVQAGFRKGRGTRDQTAKICWIIEKASSSSVSHSVKSDSLWFHWTVACQASLSMVFSRQEYWSGLPFPYPEDLSDTGS